jgi:hypothetical protein
MEFGFFRGLPENLFILDIVGQIAFLLDIVLQFFVAFRDSQTYRMVYKRTPIALRSVFPSLHDFLGSVASHTFNLFKQLNNFLPSIRK